MNRMKNAKRELSPEELMRKKQLIKFRFRAFGRRVMANTYWMMEGVDHYEGLDDVKRRVQQAVHTKKKAIVQTLSITDKALLNKAAEDRTDTEKKYLNRILGGLKCFKRYPPSVKRKLAALLYFKYYGPGRVVVQQHQEAHALYFILTGEVVVSHFIWDELEHRDVSVDIGVMHPGDMFGEVSLLHNIPRTATCTTSDHCEMLALMKEDFENVLQACVQKQWDEVQRAMSAFSYFDSFDVVSRREGCIVAKLKRFEANKVILGDGVAVLNYVYFILEGQCQMIETMRVIETKRLGKTFYTLYDPYVPPVEKEEDFEAKYFSNLNESESNDLIASSNPLLSKDEISSKDGTLNKDLSNSKNQSTIKVRSNSKDISSIKEGSVNKDLSNIKERSASKDLSVTKDKIPSKEDQMNIENRSPSNVDEKELRSKSMDGAPTFRVQFDEVDNESSTHSIRISADDTQVKVKNLRVFFMQVCLFNPGASFGFGENMRDRRIISLTPVSCMLMPKIWLLQKNTANIWTRIQHYLDKKIPTKAKLFKEFLSCREWEKFKDEIVLDVVSRAHNANYTSLHDVPYSIRMDELVDI